MPRVWRPGVWVPLQCAHLRGLQGLLPAQRHQERRVLLQVRARVRDGHVHAAQVSGVSAEEVPGGGHAARVRGAGEPVRHEAEGEEGTKGEGQSADTSAAATAIGRLESAATRFQYVRLQVRLPAGADEVRATAPRTDGGQAAIAREADAGEQGQEHSSVDDQPNGGHLQTNLVPGRVRAALRGGSQADNGKYRADSLSPIRFFSELGPTDRLTYAPSLFLPCRVRRTRRRICMTYTLGI